MVHRYFLTVILSAALPALILASPPYTIAQAQKHEEAAFDPHDVSGVWWVDLPGPEAIFARGKNKDASKCQSCHPSEHTAPEPGLTSWARDHLLIGDKGFHNTRPRVVQKPNNCDPIGIPSQFWYTQLYPFEFVATSDRIFQFFEKQNEWRAIWMKRGHPANLEPTYMGDSVGKWEGDTLVVDTIGFNGKSMIEPVGLGHLMSDSFHLVERWRRSGPSTLDLDLTYYDPKVWGDSSWGGLKHQFLLQTTMALNETYCTAEDISRFDEFLKPALQPARAKKNQQTK